MSSPFLGEIRLFSFSFAPKGWASCDGQLLPPSQNEALFALLGTTYGGNGVSDFALPDLRGRAPAHAGGGFTLGQAGGEESHTLIQVELAAHTHGASASAAAASQASPVGALWAGGAEPAFGAAATTALSPASLAATGGSLPHENRPPFLTLNFCIALQGIFPTHS